MDDEPFLSLSLKSLTNGAMRTDEIDTLERLTRARFDADHIIDQARRRLLKEELVRSFGEELRNPSDELTKLFLQRANLTYVRRKAMESTYRLVMKAAIAEALTRQVWSQSSSPASDGQVSSLVRAAAMLAQKASQLSVTGAPVRDTLCYDLYVSLFLYSGFRRFTAFHVSELLFAGLFQLSFLLAQVGF